MFQGSGGFGGGFGGNTTSGFGGGNTTSGFGGGFNNPDQSFTSPGGSRKPGGNTNKPSSLMPVTVAMMLKADHSKDEDLFNYNGVDIHLVTFVGVIQDIIEASTSITYKIEDYTGPVISVRKFIQEGEDDTSSMPRSHSYVRVYGHLRSLNDVRNVIAFAVTPLTSHNEVTMHILEVVRAQLRLKKGVSTSEGGAANGGTFTNGSSNNAGTDSSMAGLGPAQQLVFQALKKCSSDIGMSITEISKTVNNLSVVQIRSAIEFLSNEGHIYSTVDDEHYKLTDYC